MLDVGGHGLHFQLTGEGPVTVVFESGIAASSLSWQLVWPEVAKFARVCLYDRAGLGWSGPSKEPRTIANVIGDLRALLAEVPGPYILVGHSFGGLVAFEYACAGWPVAGLVLLDPLTVTESHPDLRRGVQLSRRGGILARLGVVRLSLDLLQAGSRAIPQLAARVSSGNGSKLTERLVGEVRKLPPEVWPVIQAHWCQPKAFRSMADHLQSLPASLAACSLNCDLGNLPVIVLSAAAAGSTRDEGHDRMAKASKRGQKIFAARSGHWIQLDEPELVIAAIRRLADEAANLG